MSTCRADRPPRLRAWAAGVAVTACATLAAPAVQAQLPQVRFAVSGYEVTGDNPLPERITREVLAPYTGEGLGLADIQGASDALERALTERGYAFHRVTVPPQRAAGGRFRLEVTGFALGEISVQGNSHASEAQILRSLPALEPGDTPNSREVARALVVANEHPSRRVAVFLRESVTPGFVDARVQVRDTKPWRVFASLANTGVDATGDLRLSVGAQHADVFGMDHVVTASYTTSPPNHMDEVRQRGVFYRAPLYEQHAHLDAYYLDSSTDQGRVAGIFDVAGEGRFRGLSLTLSLTPRGAYNEQLRIGVDDKLFEDESRVEGIDIGTAVRSRPLALRYTGFWQGEESAARLYLEHARNLTTGSHNDARSYADNSNGAAEPGWRAWRLGGSFDRPAWRDWQLHGRLDAQLAGEPLIPGERFGVGGVYSVRGFEERAAAGDSGAALSLELRHPVRRLHADGHLFADYGYRHLRAPLPGERADEQLASYGGGLRWSLGAHVSLAMDLAYVLNGTDERDTGDIMVHANLSATY